MSQVKEHTVQLVSPLDISFFDNEQGEDMSELEPVPNDFAHPYAREINDAITKDLTSDGSTGNLMAYWWDCPDSVRAKVKSLVPRVDFIDGNLTGICDMVCVGTLTPSELAAVKDYLTGQYSDGWGEGFEQREIKTGIGELHVSFWNHNDFSISIRPSRQLNLQHNNPSSHDDPVR